MPKTTREEKEKIIAGRRLSAAQFSVNSLPTELKEMISDGYHTFSELYEHRIELYITLCRHFSFKYPVWRSKTHSDGTSIEGWFLLGLDTMKGKQITYHLPVAKWNDCGFAMTLLEAPPFDGHTSMDVLERLRKL